MSITERLISHHYLVNQHAVPALRPSSVIVMRVRVAARVRGLGIYKKGVYIRRSLGRLRPFRAIPRPKTAGAVPSRRAARDGAG